MSKKDKGKAANGEVYLFKLILCYIQCNKSTSKWKGQPTNLVL